MAENLNYNTADGTGSWCYDNKPDSCVKYGRLYSWSTAMAGEMNSNENPSGVRGVCPNGWHLPSRAEWGELVVAAGSTGLYDDYSSAGTMLKSTTGWYSSWYNGNGTDGFGFSALPGGFRYSDGDFDGAGGQGYWWTATRNESYAYARIMGFAETHVLDNSSPQSFGYSVRCRED